MFYILPSGNALQLNSMEYHPTPELALPQTSKMFEDCRSANVQVPFLRLNSECGYTSAE